MWDTKAAVECWSSLLSHCFDCIRLRLEKMKAVSLPSADGNAISSASCFQFNYELKGSRKYQDTGSDSHQRFNLGNFQNQGDSGQFGIISMFPYIGLLTHFNCLEHLMTCLHHIEKIKFVDALYCSGCKFWVINHQCLIKSCAHTQKMHLCRTNKQTDLQESAALLPQPLVEFKVTHCVDIWCTYRNHSQLLPPSPLIFQQIRRVFRPLPLIKVIQLSIVTFARHPASLHLGSNRATPRLASTWTI